MSGQGESDMDYSDDEAGYGDYYAEADTYDLEQVDISKSDPEYFEFECLSVEEVERLLNESVEMLSNSLKILSVKDLNIIESKVRNNIKLLSGCTQITPALAKVLLHTHKWAIQEVTDKYRSDSQALLVESQIEPRPESSTSHRRQQRSLRSNSNVPIICAVCVEATNEGYFRLACGHSFCSPCWVMHFQVQISQGVSTGITCMAPGCEVLATEDFALKIITLPDLRKKYQQFTFQDYVKSHPQLRFCPGPNCQVIVRAKLPKAKKCFCQSCKTAFCFNCGIDYHAPTDCVTVKKWLTKCADDSETANYISAHTKDCPKCHICIEKNGGCNHMQCYSCKHDFCWMCLGDWKTHGSEYYECSRYKDNPNIANESAHAQAREALKKYLHYYERWENHSKSLKLEEQHFKKVSKKITGKVMNSGSGTWIDWQYLLDASNLLAKCRYTLQYTYPYAYYMEPSSRKELFEYQQASLEAEIENLSWKIERAESTDRGDLENQMDVAEKRRLTLLKDFLNV